MLSDGLVSGYRCCRPLPPVAAGLAGAVPRRPAHAERFPGLGAAERLTLILGAGLRACVLAMLLAAAAIGLPLASTAALGAFGLGDVDRADGGDTEPLPLCLGETE